MGSPILKRDILFEKRVRISENLNVIKDQQGKCQDQRIDPDSRPCKKYLFEVTSAYAKSHYGFASYGCGFCQTAVPCEAGIPRGLSEEVKI
jgi:hypothetical protein